MWTSDTVNAAETHVAYIERLNKVITDGAVVECDGMQLMQHPCVVQRPNSAHQNQ